MRAIAVIRSMVSVSTSGSGVKESSVLSLRKSRASGVEAIDGLSECVIDGVVISERFSTFESGGVRRDDGFGLGFGEDFSDGSGSAEHQSKRMRD